MINRLETSKRTKINKIEQQSEDNQQYDARLDRFCRYKTFGGKIT
jgi:hypothetical protein